MDITGRNRHRQCTAARSGIAHTGSVGSPNHLIFNLIRDLLLLAEFLCRSEQLAISKAALVLEGQHRTFAQSADIFGGCYPWDIRRGIGIDRDGKVWRALQHVRTLGIVVVGEIIFRAPGGRAALQLLAEAVRNPSIGTLFDGTVAKLGLSSADAVCLVIVLATLLVVGVLRERGTWSAERLWRVSHLAPCLMCCALFFIVIIFGAYGTGYVPVDPMYASF